jgi:hypothetical protein
VVIVRKRIRDGVARERRDERGQLRLALADMSVLDGARLWEYSVPVTDVQYPLEVVARIHRSNLVGMGILPIRLPKEATPQTLQLTPGDRIEVYAPSETLTPPLHGPGPDHAGRRNDRGLRGHRRIVAIGPISKWLSDYAGP